MSATDPAVSRRREGLVLLVLVQLAFGLFPLFVHQAVDEGRGFSARAVAVWRIALASGVLLVAARCAYPDRMWIQRRDLGRFALCSFLGIALNQLLALEGTARTSAIQAGLLFTSIPVFTYGAALLGRQEAFRPLRAWGIALALAGALLLVGLRVEGGSGGTQPLLGNALILVNCLAYALYLVAARPLLAHYPSLVVIAWMFTLSLVFTPFLGWGQELWPSATPRAWRGLAGMLLLPTVLGYLANTLALARVSASTTAVFIYLQPLVSGVAGVAILGEQLSGWALGAGGLLFAGLYLVTKRGGESTRARGSGP